MQDLSKAMLIGLVLSLMIATPVLAKDSPEEQAITARQADMDLRAYNFGPLVAMMKKEIPYDADQAQKLADNLQTLLKVDISSAWMPGTSTDEFSDKTRAKPKLWKDTDKLKKHGKDLHKAVDELANSAGQGLAALSPAVKQVGKACKNCHDDFRTKD